MSHVSQFLVVMYRIMCVYLYMYCIQFFQIHESTMTNTRYYQKDFFHFMKRNPDSEQGLRVLGFAMFHLIHNRS